MSNKEFTKPKNNSDPFADKCVKAVILAGPMDFGRCPVARDTHRALWPLVDRPVVECLIKDLYDQGIERFVVCHDAQIKGFDAIFLPDDVEIEFIAQPLARGTAGSIKDATSEENTELIMVFSAATLQTPDIHEMLITHCKTEADLTVIFNEKAADDGFIHDTSCVYICQSSIFRNVPQEGYFDLKEGLIPELIKQGLAIEQATAANWVGSFVTWPEYLQKTLSLIEGPYISDSAKIHPRAKINGSVIVSQNACVEDGAVVIGPAVIGNGAVVGSNASVEKSVLWQNSIIAEGCEVKNSLIAREASVPAYTTVTSEAITKKTFKGFVGNLRGMAPVVMKNNRNLGLIVAVSVMATFIWSYLNVIADLWQIWNRSDEYSSGMLVPLIAAYILYNSRDSLRSCKIKPCVYAVFVFIAAQVMRWVGLFFMYASAERLSMLITLAALVMLIGGVRLFRKVSPVLLFTLLMLPLPASVHARVTLPLQNVATSSAVFCLELFGFIVTREGNIIRLNDATVAVAEACNGLRMVMAFFVIASFIALLIKRPWPEKMIVVFSALPVAIVCNTIRLTATAMIFMVVDAERWESLFHDFGGYAMMPLAIGMLMAQLWLLKKLFTTDQQPAVAV